MSITNAYVVPHPPIIIPAVGGGQEARIQATINAFQEVAAEIAKIRPETIILSSPHITMYQDYFHIAPGAVGRGSFARFGAPSLHLSADYDEEFIRNLSQDLAKDGFPAGTQGVKERELDHATLVPLYFIQQRYRDFKLVRVGLSGLSLASHYRLGQYIRETADRLGRRCVYIASGDLSHRLKEDGPYGFHPQGPVYDQEIMAALATADFGRILDMDPALCEGAGECGHRSFAIMAGSLDRTKVSPRQLSYEGPFGVGYGIVSFQTQGGDDSRNFLEQFEAARQKEGLNSPQGSSPHVRLALAVIRARLDQEPFDLKEYARSEALPEEMLRQRAGVFVSLHRQGSLRGCIGTIAPTTDSVAKEIQRNAIEAAFHDPRFEPLGREELQDLHCSVDVLMEPEPITGLSELDPREYGVIVTRGRRRGLLLPNLEGIDSAGQQVAIAKQKAGIAPQEDCALERFKVVRHL